MKRKQRNRHEEAWKLENGSGWQLCIFSAHQLMKQLYRVPDYSMGSIESTIFHLGRKLISYELVVSLSSGGNIVSVTLRKYFL